MRQFKEGVSMTADKMVGNELKKDIASFRYEELLSEMERIGEKSFGESKFLAGFMKNWQMIFLR